MTTPTLMTTRTKTALWGAGAALLALPLLMPTTARADDVRISLNFGGAPYAYSYQQPVVQKVIVRPAPVMKRVVVQQPRVVYVEKHRGHGHWKHERYDRHDRYAERGYERGYGRQVAYVYR